MTVAAACIGDSFHGSLVVDRSFGELAAVVEDKLKRGNDPRDARAARTDHGSCFAIDPQLRTGPIAAFVSGLLAASLSLAVTLVGTLG